MRNLVLVFLFSLTFSLLFSQSTLTITEIMYNSPGEDLEFLEFYNAGSDPLETEGYAILDGIDYSFPAITLMPQATFVITNDSLKFQRFYGQSAREWESGSLSNGGEDIIVADNMQDTIISFTYNDNQPWSQAADGGGSSLTRCDVTNDINLPESWERSLNMIGTEEGVLVFADPDVFAGCSASREAILMPSAIELFVIEGSNAFEIDFFLDNAPDSTTLFEVTVLPSSAERDLDYVIETDTLEFNSNRNSVQSVEIEVLLDVIDEDIEFFEIIMSPINNNIDVSQTTIVNIISCNTLESAKLKLRGVIHSSEIKAIELIVLEDITAEESLSYSLGTANNGNGSDGQEFLINTVASAGSCLFVTSDTIRFKTFFGTTDNMQLIQDEELEADFNGNDAIELYQNCQLIDIYGEADVDGEGTIWEYDTGWAKRIAQNEDGMPSGFDPADWTFSGVEMLDAETNFESAVPYPIECLILDTDDVASISNLTIFPNPSSGTFTISSEQLIDQLNVIDIYGQNVYGIRNLNTYDHEIRNLSATSSIYFIQLLIEGKTIIKKVMIE